MINLKNISVRTLITCVLFLTFLYSFIALLLYFFNYQSAAIHLFLWLPLFLFIEFVACHSYMTIYLVNPVNQIQQTLKEITNGKINTPVEYFGMNCAGKLIPEIQNMQKNIISIVYTISQSAHEISHNVHGIKEGN